MLKPALVLQPLLPEQVLQPPHLGDPLIESFNTKFLSLF